MNNFTLKETIDKNERETEQDLNLVRTYSATDKPNTRLVIARENAILFEIQQAIAAKYALPFYFVYGLYIVFDLIMIDILGMKYRGQLKGRPQVW